MKLSRYEQETIINFNEEEEAASVYTHNSKLMEKPLRRFSTPKQRPDATLVAGFHKWRGM